MTDRQIMQQALEALEADEHDMVPDQEGHMVFRKEVAITALRERLAQPVRTHWEGCDEVHPECRQPEQEPVAWLVQYSNKHEFVWGQKPQWIADAIGIEPLYTTPQRREWVGLTRDEVLDIEEAAKHPLDFARSLEAKLKEKNT